MKTRLNYGIVGAGLDSFIGNVHRIAAEFDKTCVLVAGAFSTNPEKNKACRDFYGLDSHRVYDSFEEMAKAEGSREDGIDFVTITAPNRIHYSVAKVFLENGIHVFCEKPFCFEEHEAEELKKIAEEKGLFIGLNYSYSGNVMVKEARERILAGEIGKVINVNAEYLQEWLIDDVEASEGVMNKLSVWRKDPKVAGISNCVGDIGTHIEHTVSYMTGLHVKRVAAKLDYFNQPLDLNANILVEFDNGAHGVFCSSQVCVGHMNGLVVRIFGTKGAIEWQQENPNVLYVTKKGQPTQVCHRGMAYVSDYAAELNRLPSGHPEGLYVAFANMYKTWSKALLKKLNNEPLTEKDCDFPTVEAGISGVKFTHACVESSNLDAAWVTL